MSRTGPMARDYYDVLGISRDATPDEVQQAYRRLARKHHPDMDESPGAEARFKEINEAYQVLKDPKSRRRYDRFGHDFRRVPEGYEDTVGAGRFGPRGFGGGRPGGGRSGGGRRPGGPFAGEPFGGGWEYRSGIDLDDLLGGLFGARSRSVPLDGADQEAELTVAVEEAYRGGRRHLGPAGTGQPGFDVAIPPGVTDGQRIRVPGRGGPARNGGRPGDLYLVIRIAPHSTFRLQGRDIVVDLPVAPWEAALGATVPVPTPAGQSRVRVPPGSSSGRRLRLRGQGLPNPNGTPGDLYAELSVRVPTHPSDRERELFEELAKVSTFDPRTPGDDRRRT